jgi:dCMP deaminase
MKWNQRFIQLAQLVASWSKDPSTKVGAVIVDYKNRIVSVGYNGYPRGVKDGDDTREHKLMKTIHAEENALLFARGSVEGCTVYVTHPPCANCTAKLIQAGISHVCYPPVDPAFTERWLDSISVSNRMFIEAGISVQTIKEDK